MDKRVDICDKYALTLDEAAEYFGIGINRLRDITDKPRCQFVLKAGNKRLIKRRLLEKYLDEQDVI